MVCRPRYKRGEVIYVQYPWQPKPTKMRVNREFCSPWRARNRHSSFAQTHQVWCMLMDSTIGGSVSLDYTRRIKK